MNRRVAWRVLLVTGLLGAGCGDGGSSAALDAISVQAIEARASFLADDRLEGRGTGTASAERAARYIAAQFEQAGLRPTIGDSSYLQSVPLVEIESDVRLSLRAPGGASFQPAPGEELILWSPQGAETVDLSGELVFAGYGTRAAEEEWDDFKGIDVRGTILLVLSGEPGGRRSGRFRGDTLTDYGLPEYKFREAAKRGAAGLLLVHGPDHPESWEAIRRSRARRQIRPAADSTSGAVQLQGWLSREAAAQIVAMAGIDFETMVEAAGTPGFRPIATGLSAAAAGETRVRRLAGRNVIGVLPGREASDSYVLFLARYDGAGYGPPVDSDSIYNGCYRNASGTALLIALAHAFARLPEPPRRSLAFLAVIGGDVRPIGASHYVADPVIPLERTVAAINIDGANLWGRTTDAVVMGTTESDLDALVSQAVRAEELNRRGDPLPGLGRFYRSDHLPFMRAGVPVAFAQHGVDFIGRIPGWGHRMLDDYNRRVVGTPGDECTADLDYRGAVQQGRVAFRLGRAVADLEGRPGWRPGSRYGTARDSLLAGEGGR